MLKTIKEMDIYINNTITKLIKDITGYLVKRRGYVGFMASACLFEYHFLQDTDAESFQDIKYNRILRKINDLVDAFFKKFMEFVLISIHFWLYVYIIRYIIQIILHFVFPIIFNKNGLFFVTSLFFILTYLNYLSEKDDFLESRIS